MTALSPNSIFLSKINKQIELLSLNIYFPRSTSIIIANLYFLDDCWLGFDNLFFIHCVFCLLLRIDIFILVQANINEGTQSILLQQDFKVISGKYEIVSNE